MRRLTPHCHRMKAVPCLVPQFTLMLNLAAQGREILSMEYRVPAP